MVVEFENPRVLLCDQKISSIHDISHILEESLQSSIPILIIANDVDGDAMQGLVVNVSRGALKSCAIKSPGFGNARVGMMDDLSLMLNTPIVNSSDDSLKDLKFSDLGTCGKVSITRQDTVFIDCPAEKDKIEERMLSLKEALRDKFLSEDEVRILKIRLARLAGGVGIIRVGGATEGELIERKDRVDDALNATQAAIEEGIIPGGGASLLFSSSKISIDKFPEEEQAGARVMKNACTYPISQIVKNAGGSPDLVILKLSDIECHETGYDALTEEFCNMFESGIIDPCKVTRCAVENAVSAACTLLSVGCAMISEK
jgi:chaperonin GroEL